MKHERWRCAASCCRRAIRIVIPTLGNYFISLFKNTRCARSWACRKWCSPAQIVAARNFQYFTLYTVVGAMYFLVSFPAARLVGWLERRTTPQRLSAPVRMTAKKVDRGDQADD